MTFYIGGRDWDWFGYDGAFGFFYRGVIEEVICYVLFAISFCLFIIGLITTIKWFVKRRKFKKK